MRWLKRKTQFKQLTAAFVFFMFDRFVRFVVILRRTIAGECLVKLKDALIGWNPPKRCSPERDEVPGAVGVWHFKDSLIRRDCGDAELPWEKFCSTSGACDFDRAKMAPWQRLALLFIDFHTAVVRDGIDPQVMHQAFLNIDEYRVRIAPDIQGAE